NPYDVAFTHLHRLDPNRIPAVPEARQRAPIQSIGLPLDVDYPPWAFVPGAVFLWPGLPWANRYFALWNLAAELAIVAWLLAFARQQSPVNWTSPRIATALVICATLAISGF